MTEINKKFFLGANSPQGFVSRFDQLKKDKENWKCYILKGGPGTGKSTIIKKISEHFKKYSDDAELIYCSGDKSSLDAVIFPQLKFSVADGTAPHLLEPKLPGLGDKLVVLNDAICESCLSDYVDIISENNMKKSDNYKQCYKLLLAASSLLSDTEIIASKQTNESKISSFVKNFCLRELKSKKNEKGYDYVRFLSGITNDGFFTFESTIKNLCDEIIFIDDEYGSVCSPLLTKIKNTAIENGYDTISCPSPLFPFSKLDFLIIPEAKMGFVCQNKIYNFDMLPNRTIHAQRFLNLEELKNYKNRIKFNKSASLQLMERASKLLGEAKNAHEEMEKIYIGATNFKVIDKITENLINTIERDLFLQN